MVKKCCNSHWVERAQWRRQENEHTQADKRDIWRGQRAEGCDWFLERCGVSRGAKESAGTWCRCTDVAQNSSLCRFACASARPSNGTKVSRKATKKVPVGARRCAWIRLCAMRRAIYFQNARHASIHNGKICCCKKRVNSHLERVSLHHLPPPTRWAVKNGFICLFSKHTRAIGIGDKSSKDGIQDEHHWVDYNGSILTDLNARSISFQISCIVPPLGKYSSHLILMIFHQNFWNGWDDFTIKYFD